MGHAGLERQLLGIEEERRMLNARKPHRGFNLIELMVSVAILGVLLGLGVPSFAEWIRNQKIRASAESILNGMQVARSEAVRRNAAVQLSFPDSLRTGWEIKVLDPGPITAASSGTVIQSRDNAEGNTCARPTFSPGGTSTTVTFGSIGSPLQYSAGVPPLQSVDVTYDPTSCGTSGIVTGIVLSSTQTDALRKLRIVVAPGGSVRMCDPALAAPDPRAC
jgi:type IV fimbrial biogenesis protein FimT